jgi:predicted RNA-binding Zn ribbon-like protein
MTDDSGTVPFRAFKQFRLIAGNLCLDFCNTMGGKRGAIAREHLHSYSDFAGWCEQTDVITHAQARSLIEHAAKYPAEAGRVFGRALELREAIYRIFLGLSQSKKPSKADLGTLNSELALALGRLRIGATADGFQWEWTKLEDLLEGPLGPLARSAAELLTSEGQCCHVGQCQGDTCGWLFNDSSKNHSRRWCDMRDCGNRAKVRRHRRKNVQQAH